MLAARFDLGLDGDWEKLLNLWESDLLKAEGKAKFRSDRPRSEEKDEELLRVKVLDKLASGKVSKAANLLDSHGIADMSDENTKVSLRKNSLKEDVIFLPTCPKENASIISGD